MKPLADILIQYIKQQNKIVALFYVVFNVMPVTAQFSSYNLVPNPSFENYNCCPVDIYTATYGCKPDIWYEPDKRGATYFNTCANNNLTGVPVNFFLGG
ncbi:MAG TPA: hypothetical protein PKJ70_07940 [Chitinophagaceae bacterium]|nr:hypothetical protein [Chitinophagaceae bacterium]HNN31803.1 hypothetical protein [Chitinophagaceae bacterium]